MVFVTSQPDVPYFHWQIRVYVENFTQKGINPNDIHILLGIVTPNTEPSQESIDLKKLGVNVHHYIDDRHDKKYIPSIKPFLIHKWLKQYPEFGDCFFLHDSDIIFRELPNFNKLLNDDIIYLSDTIGYIGYKYIIDCCDRYEKVHPNSGKGQLLEEMCDVVGITSECVKCNEKNSGGGQYIIKNTDWVVWEKIYTDSTGLYYQMLDYQKRYPINPGEIQFWTAEMWSLLWNLWYFDKETRISKELDFSWATDNIKTYNKKPILHMAGVTDDLKTRKFFKGEFININPLVKLKENPNYFNYIEKDSCTIKYVEIMLDVIKNQQFDYLL
jgi:hypothetical protein